MEKSEIKIELTWRRGDEKVLADVKATVGLSGGGCMRLDRMELVPGDPQPRLRWPGGPDSGQFARGNALLASWIEAAALKEWGKVAEVAELWEEYLCWWHIERELGGLDPATRDRVDQLFHEILTLNNQVGLAPFEGISRPERFVNLLTASV